MILMGLVRNRPTKRQSGVRGNTPRLEKQVHMKRYDTGLAGAAVITCGLRIPTCAKSLSVVGLGAHTFDDAALLVILRAVQGNLRLCRNLCYASLVATCLDHQRICTLSHVNAALQQPHWRSHEALLKQQVKPVRMPS